MNLDLIIAIVGGLVFFMTFVAALLAFRGAVSHEERESAEARVGHHRPSRP